MVKISDKCWCWQWWNSSFCHIPWVEEGFTQDSRRHRPSHGFHLKATIFTEKTWWSRLLLFKEKKKQKVGVHRKRKQKKPCSEKVEGSDAESGEEIETEHEMDRRQQFRNLMQNIKFMDKELALVCAENLSEQFHSIFFGQRKYGCRNQEFDAIWVSCSYWSAVFVSVTFLFKSSAISNQPLSIFSDPKQAGTQY